MAKREQVVEGKPTARQGNGRGPRIRAIAMISGGLDSILAAAVVRRAAIDVLGLHIRHLFSASAAGEDDPIARAAEAAGVPLRVLDRSEEHLDVIRHPRHGVGAGVNPCIDCRIFVLQEARLVMEEEGAQFVFTGEVLGQRPMSQHRQAMELIARRSGLGDRLLRPLSARFLPESLPVREGWITLDQLPEIRGRGRAEQLALAAALGIDHTPQPAGGCVLVEKAYAARLRDAFGHLGPDHVTRAEFERLGLGRHFRLNERVKLVVGRDERENERLAGLATGHTTITPHEIVGPLSLLDGDADETTLRLACAVAARYSDHEGRERVTMVVAEGGRTRCLEVAPLAADDPRIPAWRIG
jgi:hypothetical protein